MQVKSFSKSSFHQCSTEQRTAIYFFYKSLFEVHVDDSVAVREKDTKMKMTSLVVLIVVSLISFSFAEAKTAPFVQETQFSGEDSKFMFCLRAFMLFMFG